MDDNYTGNGSNNANGFQSDRYFLDTCSAYISSHSKHNNDKTPYELWKGSVENNLYIKKFAKNMQNEFEMSLLGELSFFLGLHICQSNRGIFISQTKHIIEMLKRFRMED
jgi:hypothetical protein